ncbi:transposase [Hymenobacter elongatus]|uniref:transposase n=1 Tax=Hymenobacter elongatus TaxID=877208 RepID=UPI001436BF33
MGSGQRAHQATLLHSGPNVTLVAALTPSGLQAAKTVSRLSSQVLGPTLCAGDVAVLDNLLAHTVAGLAELVEARGARLLYLPPYSPDFTPSNWPSASSKPGCARHARTREALEAIIQTATDWITELDAKNWFYHCGYHVH